MNSRCIHSPIAVSAGRLHELGGSVSVFIGELLCSLKVMNLWKPLVRNNTQQLKPVKHHSLLAPPSAQTALYSEKIMSGDVRCLPYHKPMRKLFITVHFWCYHSLQ